MENSRDLDCVVDGYPAEVRFRDRTRIRAQGKDRCVLIRKHPRERRTVCEVSMQNLCQLGMRNAELPAPDRRYTADSRILKRAAQGVSADHPRCAHNYKALLVRKPDLISRCHESTRSSSQSTYSCRSANSHTPSNFTNVSI